MFWFPSVSRRRYGPTVVSLGSGVRMTKLGQIGFDIAVMGLERVQLRPGNC